MNTIQKKYGIIAEIWDTCMKVMDTEVPEGEYYEYSFDFGYFMKYWKATNFDYNTSLPCIKNTVNSRFYYINGLDFDVNGQCTMVFLESTVETHNYVGAYELHKPFRMPDFSAIDLDVRLLRSIADWLHDQWKGYHSWRIRNDKDYMDRILEKCEVNLDGDIKPASIIDPRNKENGCHQKCPDGYDMYNEDWFLSPKGDMCNRCSDYFIEADQLREDDWILHCMERRWFDGNTFIPAYWEACRRAGIKKVTMRIEY